MKEIKYGNARVRIHGTVNEDKLKESTEKFLKKVKQCKKK